MAIPAASFAEKQKLFAAMQRLLNDDKYVVCTLNGLSNLTGIAGSNVKNWVKQFDRMGVVKTYRVGSTTLVKVIGVFTEELYDEYLAKDRRHAGNHNVARV